MFRYAGLAILLLSMASLAQAEIVNYVTPDQAELSQPQKGVKTIVVEDDDLFGDMDKLAAKHGDDHAMGTLANSCLRKKDYACAYQWAGTALRGSYWQSQGLTDKIKDIQNEAKSHLSEEEISNLDKEIKEFRPH